MWLTKIFTAVLVVLTGLLPSSCTNTKTKVSMPQQHAPNQTAPQTSTPLNDRDLGELEMTNHYETCVQLGAGKSCTIRPNVVDRKNLQLILSFETKKPDGKIAGLSVVQVSAQPGKPFEVAFGDLNITLTPKIVE